MNRITLDALMARLEGRDPVPTHVEGVVDEARLRARQRLETSLSGVALMLNVALLERAVEDFPGTIPLGPLFSGREDLSLELGEDGVWRFQGPVEDILHADISPAIREFSLGTVLITLGVHGDEESAARLDEVANWRGTPFELAVKLASVAARVQPHVLAASLVLGDDLLVALGIGLDHDMREAWTQTVAACGIDVNAPPAPGMSPPSVALAAAGKYEGLDALMRAGGDIRARNGEGMTPLLAAARAGSGFGVMRCSEWGADAAGETTDDGRNALHCAAEAAAEGLSDEFRGTWRLLVNLGADPGARDARGRTPEDILEGAPPEAVRRIVGGRDRAPAHEPR